MGIKNINTVSDLFFQIFKKTSDHNNWDKQIEYYSKSTDISNDRRTSILEALNYLREHLFNGFLKSTKNKHPVKIAISNKATHSIDWLIWLYKSLKSYEHDQENFNIIKQKLNRVDKAIDEGIPFLEVASALQKSGFKVEFEPAIAGYNKKPDLKIINTENNEVIYIEVSVVKESMKRNRIVSNYMNLNWIMEGRGIHYTGRIYEILSDEDLLKIKAQINDLISKCVDDNQLRFLTLEQTENKVEVAITNQRDVEKLKDWTVGKGLRMNEIQSIDINFGEDIDRIINNKIKKEAKQIPTEHVGFIYLRVHPLVLKMDLPWNIAQEIKKKLLEFDHIVGILLWSDVLETNGDSVAINFGNFFYSQFSMSELRTRLMLMVLNENFTNKISKKSMNKIFKSMEVN